MALALVAEGAGGGVAATTSSAPVSHESAGIGAGLLARWGLVPVENSSGKSQRVVAKP